jgi:hypothetical protein
MASEVHRPSSLLRLAASSLLRSMLLDSLLRRDELLATVLPHLRPEVKKNIGVLPPTASRRLTVRRSGLVGLSAAAVALAFSKAERARVRRLLRNLPKDQRIALKTAYGAMTWTGAAEHADVDLCAFALSSLRHPSFPDMIVFVGERYDGNIREATRNLST